MCEMIDIRLRNEIERQIVERIVTDAVKMEFRLSVDDREGFVLKRSTDVPRIMDALMNTDQDEIYFYDNIRRYIGSVTLIYGNAGYDVIADYSLNPTIETIIAGANELAEKLEEKYSAVNQ